MGANAYLLYYQYIFYKSQEQCKHYPSHLGANVHLFETDAWIQDPDYLATLNCPLRATLMEAT